MKKTLIITTIFLIILLSAGIIYLVLNKKFAKNSQSTFPVVHQTEGQLVSGFPTFPLYPGATITSTQKNEATASQPVSYQAYLESDKTVSEIIDWYSQNIQSSGWSIVRPADNSQPDDQNIVITKDNETATVNAEKEGDSGTTISISIIIK